MENTRNEKGQFVKGNFKDRTGEKVNRLTFLELDRVHVTPSGHRKPYWKVQCDCGSVFSVLANSVTTGHTKSCGCLHKEATSVSRTKHGESDTRLYYIWENMKKRCLNPKVEKYKNYGARGISIYEAWLDYVEFSSWAKSSGYSDELTLERIDVNGDYTPANCKWITHTEQARNRTTNKWVTIEGERYSPSELEELYNIPVKTIYARIARGDSGESVVRPLGQRQFKKR